MIDTSKTIRQLLDAGMAIVILTPVTLLTDDPAPLHIGALDVHLFHRTLKKSRHDSKPWKMASGTANIEQAMINSEQTLATAAAGIVVPKIMAEHTVI